MGAKLDKKYKDLFKVEMVETRKGLKQKVIYTGKYYVADMPKNDERRYKLCLVIIPFLIAALFIFMGLLNNDGSRVFYVVMPYILQFLPISYMIISAVLLYINEQLTEMQYDKSFIRYKSSATGVLILSFAAIMGEIVFVLKGSGSTPELELIFLICNIIIALSAVATLQIHKKMKFKTKENANTLLQ